MSNNNFKKASSGSSGSFGLANFIGTTVAFFSNGVWAGFTKATGVGLFKSLLVGSGTGIGAGLLAFGGGIAGLAAGGATYLLTKSKKAAAVVGMAVGITGVVGGGIYGGIEGYKAADGFVFGKDGKKTTLDIKVKTTFNEATKTDTNTYVASSNDFKNTPKVATLAR